MCEVLAVAWAEPSEFDRVLPWAAELEHLGVAGFGWGVAWNDDDGTVHGYRHPTSVRDDPQGGSGWRGDLPTVPGALAGRASSTVQLADTQPFVAEDGAFAFCHNGQLDRHEEHRGRLGSSLAGKPTARWGSA